MRLVEDCALVEIIRRGGTEGVERLFKVAGEGLSWMRKVLLVRRGNWGTSAGGNTLGRSAKVVVVGEVRITTTGRRIDSEHGKGIRGIAPGHQLYTSTHHLSQRVSVRFRRV